MEERTAILLDLVLVYAAASSAPSSLRTQYAVSWISDAVSLSLLCSRSSVSCPQQTPLPRLVSVLCFSFRPSAQ